MRALVVTADDLGLDEAIDRGAARAHDEGIVTACSVVACGSSFEHAVALLRARPALDAGVHLTLSGAAPASDPAGVRSLLGPDGRFVADWRAFAARYLAGRIDSHELELELRAQVERLAATGIPIVHMDGHQHLHLLPGVLRIVLRIAGDFHIRYLRIPLERASLRGGPRRCATLALLAPLARRAAAATRRARVGFPHRTLGIAEAGHLDLVGLLALIPRVVDLTELVCHPGDDDEALERATGWDYGWEGELATLCDRRVREALEESGVELASFGSIGRAS